jgi:hypothetical protein
MPNPAWRAAGWLFTYAMVDFELCEKLTRRPNFSIFYVFKTLADALFRRRERRYPSTADN